MPTDYTAVRYELLRPSEVRDLQQQCPIVYIPVGSLEWHGVQNPLGTDALKAHAVCCEAALISGGVVIPPLFLGMLGDSRGWGPEGWDGYTISCHDQDSMRDTIYRLARGLVADSWKVLVGVTGHDVEPQRDAIHDGIQEACAGHDATGFGVTEGENWEGGASMKCSMDHAGAWETSCMMYAHPDRVNLSELKEQMSAHSRENVERSGMNEPEGIGGWNPLKYASEDLGKSIVQFCAKRIAEKATGVLNGTVTPLEKADKAFMDNPGPTD